MSDFQRTIVIFAIGFIIGQLLVIAWTLRDILEAVSA